MINLLAKIDPISLPDMQSVKLMNRMDIKFVTTMPMLMRLLEMVRSDYYAQEINGERNMLYDTTYFDTPDFSMYSDHLHGHVNRQKMRFRTYVNSQLQFMEVKTKNNRGRTKKKRIAVSDMNLADEAKRAFLQKNLKFDVDTLVPHMHNYFHRVTLVNKGRTERVTIDTDLSFHNLLTGGTRHFDDLVIIEPKRDGHVSSPVLGMLRQLRIHPHGFSKYCMGAAMTNQALPMNNFKQKLRDVDKILGGM